MKWCYGAVFLLATRVPQLEFVPVAFVDFSYQPQVGAHRDIGPLVEFPQEAVKNRWLADSRLTHNADLE